MDLAIGTDRIRRGHFSLSGAFSLGIGYGSPETKHAVHLSLTSYEQRRAAETQARRTLGQLRNEDGSLTVGTPEEQAAARETLLRIIRNPC